MAEPESHQSRQEGKRKAGERAEQGQRQPIGDAARQVGLFDDPLCHQENECEAAHGDDRGEAASLTRGAVPPAPVEDRQHCAYQRDRDVQLRVGYHCGRLGVIDQQWVGGAVGAALLGGIGDQETGQLNHRRVEVGDGDQETISPALQPAGWKRQQQLDEQGVDQHLAE